MCNAASHVTVHALASALLGGIAASIADRRGSACPPTSDALLAVAVVFYVGACALLARSLYWPTLVATVALRKRARLTRRRRTAAARALGAQMLSMYALAGSVAMCARLGPAVLLVVGNGALVCLCALQCAAHVRADDTAPPLQRRRADDARRWNDADPFDIVALSDLDER